MKKSWCAIVIPIVVAVFAVGAANPASSDELVVKSCAELISLAESCRADLRTVELVLEAAIDAGDLDRIRNFKLRRGKAKKELEAVLKALNLKSCVGSR